MILVDCRELEGRSYGVGRYLRNLLRLWKKDVSKFTLIYREKLPPEAEGFPSVKIPGPEGWKWENFHLTRFLVKHSKTPYFTPGYTLPAFSPNPMAFVLHDVSFLAHPEWFKRSERWKLKVFSRISSSKARVIFTVSEFSKREIIKFLKVEESKIVVTPQGLDPSIKCDEKKALSFREKYGIKGPMVLYVGAIFQRRNLPLLIAAFEKVERTIPEAFLVIIGENRSYPRLDLKELSSNLRNFFHLDYVEEDELVGAYSAADLFVYPSEYEGFGMPPMEALACQTPVILYPAEALMEIYGDSAVWLESKDPSELAKKMLLLLENPSFGKRLLQKRDRVLQKFSWEDTARKIKEYLLEME